MVAKAVVVAQLRRPRAFAQAAVPGGWVPTPRPHVHATRRCMLLWAAAAPGWPTDLGCHACPRPPRCCSRGEGEEGEGGSDDDSERREKKKKHKKEHRKERKEKRWGKQREKERNRSVFLLLCVVLNALGWRR